MKKLVSKIILATLLATFLVAPFQVLALSPIGGSVPIVQLGETDLGFISTAGSTATDTIAKAATLCAAADTIGSQVSSILAQGLNLLGENTAQAAALQTQIGVVDTAITCWQGVVTSASTTSTFVGKTVFGFNKINALKDQGLTQIVNLKAIRKQLEGRLQVAAQSFWKAVLVGLLLKQTDHLAEKLVTELTEKFKINDYSQYISAVTDTVYTNSMILRYVEKDRDKAIVRSMITNPLLKNGIHPAVQAAADAYVGYSKPENLRFSDPNWTNGVAKMASADEYMHQYQSAMIAKTDEVIAKAREAASSEVSQSGGYKSTLNNCGPSITLQKQKDDEYQAILKEIEDRDKLNQQIQTNKASTPQEKSAIDTDVKKAHSKLEGFTDNFGKAVVHICEGTNTPAAKFKDTIHDLIGSQIKKFSEYNDNNLNFLQKFVVSIADNLVNKFVFGKNTASTGDLIKESAGSIVQGIQANIKKPSDGIPGSTVLSGGGTPASSTPTSTTIVPPPINGQSAPGTSGGGNTAGAVTTVPYITFMPRGPTTVSLR